MGKHKSTEEQLREVEGKAAALRKKLADEQRKLINTSFEYNPTVYKNDLDVAFKIGNPPSIDSSEFLAYVKEVDQLNAEYGGRGTDFIGGVIDHIIRNEAAVDVLICTPGRLLEHLSSTQGFHLSGVRWLVLDEADKLLDEQYDG